MNNSFVAIIPAAGKSLRFSSEIQKPFIKIEERMIVELSLVPILDFSECVGVCVVIPQDDQHTESLIPDGLKVFTTKGGNSRTESVENGLKFWRDFDISFNYILIHDAARPCLRSSDVQILIDSLDDKIDGAILGSPCSDTIKEVCKEELKILTTLDRTKLWTAFTPQIFKKESLYRAFSSKSNNLEATDEASLVEESGGILKIVKGHKDNIKVTFPEDLALVKSILLSQGRLEG